MTQTQPAPPITGSRPARSRRADRLLWARIIVFGEAVLMVYIGITLVGDAFHPKDGGSVLAAVLAVFGIAVLVWGAIHIGRDVLPPPDSEIAAVDVTPDGIPLAKPLLRRVPWDWSDFIIFWPGAFVAASLLEGVTVPLADLGLNGVDATVKTAVESFVQSAAYYSGALFNLYVLVGLRRDGTLHDLGWRRFQWWWIPVAVGAAYLTLNVADFLQQFSQQILPNQTNQQCITVRHEFGHFIVLAILVVCVMAPLAEETIFRGFVYGWLRRWSPVVLAVPISAAIFAALHEEVLLFLPLFAVGCVLALMYQGSRSIWPSALVHALFNLPGIIAILNATSCQ